MKTKAVFFATTGIVNADERGTSLPTATITSDKWRALRLLTIAGYTIVLFKPDTTMSYAGCRGEEISERSAIRSGCLNSQPEFDLCVRSKPILHAAYKLQIDLTNSWMVGDMLNSIEIGRWIGCKTVLLTDGREMGWDMTDRRWPDLIAGDFWEIACLIVMSDGSCVDGLSSSVEYDD
jgi:histidinol phosphatase-like enzyme